jgi:2,4-dienoyl-CoA reductase-like NADH-dependent reductase (Old Yellow Enzyme family)
MANFSPGKGLNIPGKYANRLFPQEDGTMSLLFTPVNIGTLELPNRIMRSATAERMADEKGYPREQFYDFYRTLAAGGTGLIVTGHMYVHPSGKCHPEMTGVYEDEQIPGLARLADVIHAEGGKVIVQINHGGMQCAKDIVKGTIAPSAIADDFLPQPAREMSLEEVELLIDAYAQAARRVQEAGFDGVQLHGAHGYLINQFISPFVNQRNDEWGGNFEHRIGFLREVTKAVRKQVGEDYLVMIKFGMQDGIEGGLSADEGARVITKMAKMGLDGIEISGGIRSTNSKKGIRRPEEEAYFRPLVQQARLVTDLPLALVGGLRTLGVMEDVLASGNADLVSLCRPLISEPDFPNQLKAGLKDKSRCISANNCWAEESGMGIGCKCPLEKVKT